MVLHQMTWPPQSPDLKPIQMAWDELDRRVKENQPTSAQNIWELLQDGWKSIPHEAG
jgi:transposase